MGPSGKIKILSTAASPGLLISLILAVLGQAELARVRGQANQSPTQVEKNREKAYLRMQFARHFRAVQVVSQGLVKAVEEGTLTGSRLVAESREVNKSARALRTMIALGELAQEEELKVSFSSRQEFDEAVRNLGELVRKFARNPSHQNSRILNTDQATAAQTDLLSIIRLSKALSQQGKSYRRGD